MREPADTWLIRRWWGRWPDANMGVVTGAASGLVVLDVDPRHGGFDSLAVLEAVHGPIPPTVGAFTGGGGEHLYFRHPHTFVPCRPIAPGLDLKGDGGLVVCPPSVHVSGRHYGWKPGCAPGEVAVGDTPWWVRLAAPRSGSSAIGARTARPVVVRTEGERDSFAELWRLVGIELRPGDHNYLCPFHPDHNPSLHVDAEGCRFYCFGCGLGGGSGRLRHLVGSPGEHSTRQGGDIVELPGPCAPAPIPTLRGGDELRVVGDAPYQDVLLKLTGGRRQYGGVHFACVARLVPEPTNPADPAAIAVTIGGQKVGYLSRMDAARYSRVISNALAGACEATCNAIIVGGWERPHGRVGMFGVRLDLGPQKVPSAPDTSRAAQGHS